MVQITEWGSVYLDNGELKLDVKALNKTYTPKDHEALRYYRGINESILDKADRPDSFKDSQWFRLAYSFSNKDTA